MTNSNIHSDERDVQLLKSLLQEVDDAAASASPGDHLDEETLALFSVGGLTGDERDVTVHHLSQCAACRKTASLLLSIEEEETATVPFRSVSIWRPRAWIPVAAAASVLIVAGLLFLMQPSGTNPVIAEQQTFDEAGRLLAQADFGAAGRILSEATAGGISSDRLHALRSQVLREIPGTTALGSLGRLSDFGYEIGGVAIRDPGAQSTNQSIQAAREALGEEASGDQTLLLNRGHVRLAMGELEKAHGDFQAVLSTQPDEPLAWLGQGLAYYMQNDFASAEDAFRQCLKLEPENLAVRINLAMTLGEQGKLSDALEIWKSLLNAPLEESERRRIEREIEELEQHLK